MKKPALAWRPGERRRRGSSLAPRLVPFAESTIHHNRVVIGQDRSQRALQAGKRLLVNLLRLTTLRQSAALIQRNHTSTSASPDPTSRLEPALYRGEQCARSAELWGLGVRANGRLMACGEMRLPAELGAGAGPVTPLPRVCPAQGAPRPGAACSEGRWKIRTDRHEQLEQRFRQPRSKQSQERFSAPRAEVVLRLLGRYETAGARACRSTGTPGVSSRSPNVPAGVPPRPSRRQQLREASIPCFGSRGSRRKAPAHGGSRARIRAAASGETRETTGVSPFGSSATTRLMSVLSQAGVSPLSLP